MMVSIAGPMVVPNLAMNGMIAMTISGEAALTSFSPMNLPNFGMTFGFIRAAMIKA